VTRILFVLAVVAVTTPLAAHHSFPAYYFEDQSVSIEGDIVEFEYRAPHAWVHLNVLENGTPQKFSAEWSNPNRLNRDKVHRDTLRAGDRVVITGSPGRTASERKIHLKKIVRPADGWKWESARRR
jgi:hypothetical protein